MLGKKKSENKEPVKIRVLSYKDLQKLVKEVERVSIGFDGERCKEDSIEIVFMSDGRIIVHADFVYFHDEELDI